MEIISLIIALVALILAAASSHSSGKFLLEQNKKSEDDGRYKQKLDTMEKTLQELTEMLPTIMVSVNAVKLEISELLEDYNGVRDTVIDHEKFLTSGKQPRKDDEKEEPVH